MIMTPHIGGSTEEAQAAIGREVATALVKYVNTGSTAGAVNFPQVCFLLDLGAGLGKTALVKSFVTARNGQSMCVLRAMRLHCRRPRSDGLASVT